MVERTQAWQERKKEEKKKEKETELRESGIYGTSNDRTSMYTHSMNSD